MSLIGGFKADEVPKGNAIPEKTEAVCLVIEAEDCQSTNDPENSQYLKLTVEVVDGPFKSRRIWPMFCLKNPNPETVRIASVQLASLCLAIGCPHPQSNNDLLNKPFRATFGKPREFNGEDQSNIKKYSPVGGSSGVTQNLGPQGAPANKPAWAKS